MNKDDHKSHQYYIPFSAVKGYETFKDRKNGNLSNMKSQLMANQSTDKSRGIKRKEMVEFQQLDVGNIQTKLKKLIGATRPSPDSRTQDKKKDAFNLTDSQKKDRREKSGQKKKKMKLNISTESVGKAHGAGLCSPSNDVDALLNQRFAATAPHRDYKDKKLFTCSRKDHKVSHKAIAKKVPDEISKKIQRSHIDLISTFKGAQSSNLTRKVQTPTEGRSNLPSSMLKALKHNIQDGNQLGSAKNKSFKSDKISDYLRYNFFLKNSGVMSKEMADGGISKAVSKNRTTDSILKQLQRNNMTSVERGNKTTSKTSLEIISEKDAAKLNIEDLTFIEKKLNSIATTMNKDFEIYDQIKEYVDIIQEENFGEFYEHLKSSQARLIIKNSMVLERWVMFFVFFFYFNQPKAKPIMHHLKELVFLVHRNSISYLKLFSQWIAKYESLEPTYKSVNNIILKRSMESHHCLDTKAGDELSKMRSNNSVIIAIFKKTSSLVQEKIQDGILEICSRLDKLTIKDGLDKCLDSFCEFLIEKGVVSVEYTSEDGRKSQDTPQTNTTAGQKEDTSTTNFNTSTHPYGKPEAPFLPSSSKKFTLVMDLDETLVHYEDNGVMGQFYLRPYAQEFIDEMAKYYEVVIFTAALQDYADWIIDRLDSNKSIKYRLYRQHTSIGNSNYHVKDLSRLGRDLSKTIIVDNIPENFQLQAENGIFIKSWFRDPEDLALYELMPLLREIVQKGVPDVRIALRRFREKMIDNIRKGCLQPHLNLTLD